MRQGASCAVCAMPRFSDVPSSGDIFKDVHETKDGLVGFLDVRVIMTRSKTSFNLERKTRYLPMNAPIQGYWHGGKSCKRMALRLKKEGPYFRPPQKQEVGKKRAPMTTESGACWLRNLLCQAGEDVAATKKLGTHSLKAICLSSPAKWGLSY